MKEKIERIRYTALRVDEFTLVAIYTIDICGKYNNEILYLGKSYGELSSFRSALESLQVNVRKNEKLIRLGKLDTERGSLIRCVNNVVNNFEGVNLPEISESYEILSALLDKHKTKTIASDSRTSETERLQKLEADVNASSDIQEAFRRFGLQAVVNRLFVANREYDAMFREYIADESTKERIDITELRKNCTKTLGQYFDAVQYCAFAYDNIDYRPLINELKQLSAYYNQQLKARATRRKNGKTTDEEPPIEPPKV
jgi:glutathione S-transferase